MRKNTYPGKLIAFEGVDGSGKGVQINLLMDWLQVEGYGAVQTKRKNSKLIAQTIQNAKNNRSLSPITYSLIHAADTSDILAKNIIPALQAGFIVLINKYILTSFARDVVRGSEHYWVRQLYDFAMLPDITFYFKTTPERSLENLGSISNVDFYDAGMDIGFSPQLEKSFTMFQSQLTGQFELLHADFKFITINSFDPVQQQQQLIRKVVKGVLP
ncbi:MAG: thymidylate kinase [Candidatus Margulisiibacteriota bacterium]|nr:MAG: hypothetical protein A2X43_08790 [Candidatus Margulisbacteria bacterium GWD2_39_127]OGI02664.1 MAG: hypothetical protein A2X42_00260 [Candidatus Margulisbacteria bacterium GWF2_38_17]OGI05951.1 MAG: hypothetical protein A2X41_07725 [Candidatus Margulisbacteria bacterium GWE2_39_32]PZM79995.1 MAG: thymidylate kinase [Candidatus Margulisiibacteriota bacterium]HAR63942.1 thymidylate kinase [Candidatus Margulisiibacteriota bacterium]